MMGNELRLFGDRFRSCPISAAGVGVHRLVPNVTAEPERDSIPQGATPACWVVQDKQNLDFWHKHVCACMCDEAHLALSDTAFLRN